MKRLLMILLKETKRYSKKFLSDLQSDQAPLSRFFNPWYHNFKKKFAVRI